MIRHCDGNDPNLLGSDGTTPCNCGRTFDDVRYMVTFPHLRVGGEPLLRGHRVPVPDDVRETGNKPGKIIGESLPAGWGFGLFLFTYGPGGTMFWISSAQRSDMINALSEWIHTEGS